MINTLRMMEAKVKKAMEEKIAFSEGLPLEDFEYSGYRNGKFSAFAKCAMTGERCLIEVDAWDMSISYRYRSNPENVWQMGSILLFVQGGAA